MLGIGLVLTLALAFTWFNTKTQRNELQGVFNQQATALAFNIAVSSNSHLLEKDFAIIETLLLKANGFKDLYSATVVSADGQVLAQVLRDSNTQRLSPRYDVARLHVDKRDLHTQLLSSERHLTVIEPIESGRLIGHVVLEFDLTPLQARQSELIERNILLAVILIFPAALALWLFIRKTILELNALTDFAQRMVKDQGIEQAASFSFLSGEFSPFYLHPLSFRHIRSISSIIAQEEYQLKEMV